MSLSPRIGRLGDAKVTRRCDMVYQDPIWRFLFTVEPDLGASPQALSVGLQSDDVRRAQEPVAVS